jgi:hypothetical protein
VAGQIDRKDAVALQQLRQQLDPVPGRAGEPVEQEQRLSLPADVVPQRPRAPRFKVRCGRHPGRVSSDDHGNLGAAGPLIPVINEACDVLARLSAMSCASGLFHCRET